MATENEVNAVIAPSHYLTEENIDSWLRIDCHCLIELRNMLEIRGGGVAVDCSVIISHTLLRDSVIRGKILDGIKGLPFSNLWIRGAGFGADCSATGLIKYMESVQDFHDMGKGVVIDCVGGLAANAILAFGTSAGVASGLDTKHRFGTSDWFKPSSPSNSRRFSQPRRVHIFDADRSFTVSELAELGENRSARRILGCPDRHCCRNGFSDMLAKPKNHAAFQRRARIQALQKVPDLNRPGHFLQNDVANSERMTRNLRNLKLEDSSMIERFAKQNERIIRLGDALTEKVSRNSGSGSRSAPMSYENQIAASSSSTGD